MYIKKANYLNLTIPKSTISSINCWSLPLIASRIVCSVCSGIIEKGKQATSFGVFIQSESATQWILAEKKQTNFILFYKAKFLPVAFPKYETTSKISLKSLISSHSRSSECAVTSSTKQGIVPRVV